MTRLRSHQPIAPDVTGGMQSRQLLTDLSSQWLAYFGVGRSIQIWSFHIVITWSDDTFICQGASQVYCDSVLLIWLRKSHLKVDFLILTSKTKNSAPTLHYRNAQTSLLSLFQGTYLLSVKVLSHISDLITREGIHISFFQRAWLVHSWV